MDSPRIGAYNVLIPRTDKPDKGADSWYLRRDDVVKTVLEEFELVGLQECSFGLPCKQGEFITEELLAKGWETYNPTKHKLFSDCFHERLPIFWKPEAFTLESAGQLLMSSWSPDELAKVPILENRYASFVRGKLASGRQLLFVTLHMQHQTITASELEKTLAHAKREESQRRLLTTLMNTRKPDELVIVAGDFNTAERLAILEQAGLREVDLLAKTKERWEYNSFHDWETHKTGVHFDRIFVTPELAGGHARIGESLASDHFPVSYRIPELQH